MQSFVLQDVISCRDGSVRLGWGPVFLVSISVEGFLTLPSLLLTFIQNQIRIFQGELDGLYGF